MPVPFLHLLNSTITYAPLSGRTNDGVPTFGAQVELVAYVDAEQKLVRNFDGEEVVSTHAITTQAEIPAEARVWLPGQATNDDTLARVPIVVIESPHPQGTYSLFETRL